MALPFNLSRKVTWLIDHSVCRVRNGLERVGDFVERKEANALVQEGDDSNLYQDGSM